MIIKNKTFDGEKDRDSGAIFENYVIERCTFDNCALSFNNRPSRRSTVRNVQLLQCKCINSLIGPAIIEDTVINGLSINDLLIFEGALFQHVVLKGKIGAMKIISRASFVDITAKVQSQFDEQRLAYYAKVDWALDISQAQFSEFDFQGIPAKVVRRDLETQVVVKRENITGKGWKKKIASWNTYWSDILELRIGGPDEEFVLVAPKGKKSFRKLVDGLKDLRAIGVAEPD